MADIVVSAVNVEEFTVQSAAPVEFVVSGALIGPAGVPGADGATGPTGPQGVAGAIGPQGVAGATGAQGIQGSTGPVGANGASGLPGVTGSPGPAGPSILIDTNGVAWALSVDIDGSIRTSSVTPGNVYGTTYGVAVYA